MIEPGDIDTRAPYPGESLYGFVADVTGANKLVRVALIAGAADRMHGHRPQLATTGWDELPALAKILEVDLAELQLRSHHVLPNDPGRRAFFGTSVAKADISTRVRRFSPAALAKKPFHRAMWQLRIPFDDETGEILVSDCPLCRQTQRWRHSAGVGFCDGCGDSLDQPTDCIEDELLPEITLAVGLTHTDPARRAASLAALPHEVAALGPAMAFELLLRLVPVAEPRCSWSSADRIWRNDPHLIARGMHGAWRLLSCWPNAIRNRISQDIAAANRRFADGNQGATLRFLKLRDAEYLQQNLREVIRRLHESIDTAGPNGPRLRGETMTCVEVAKALSHGTAQVVALRRNSIFRTIGVARGPVLVPAFDRAEVMDVACDKRGRRDLDRANARLGLPYYAVEQLSALGRLPLLTHPFFKARYAEPQTTREALDHLCDRLIRDRTSRTPDDRPILTEMRMVGGRLKPWDAVIEAMLSGDLPYSLVDGTSPIFQRVHVRRENLLPYLQAQITRGEAITQLKTRIDTEFPFIDTMTKCDAAEVLNLAVKQATMLLSEYGTTPEPIVPIAEIEKMAKTYVTNTEIAVRLDMASQTVRGVARRLGIKRACEAGYERVHEAELVEALQATITTKPRLKSGSPR
jgi:hypothetical protein